MLCALGREESEAKPRKGDDEMRERIGISPQEVDRLFELPDTDELPLPVVPDWDALVSKSTEVAKVIDRHLDYESIYQGHDLNPAGLCPQQRVNLVSDLTAVV
jgi:hypothetical protein